METSAIGGTASRRRAAGKRRAGTTRSSSGRADTELTRAKRSRRVAPASMQPTSCAPTRIRGGKLQLCELGERMMLSFLPMLPERLNAEAVCKRWHRLSMQDVAIEALDFERVVLRSITKRDIVQMLQRANGQLRRLALPDMQLDDSVIQSVLGHTNLKVFRAHGIQKKHVFQVLAECRHLESLELLDCQGMQLTGWARSFAPVRLREVRLNACTFLTNPAACSLIGMCGSSLETLVLTGAINVDSQILRHLATTAAALSKLTMSHCREVKTRDLAALMEAFSDSLRWLDFSFCARISSFPASPPLPHLEVLMLDRTKMSDAELKAIARIAPHLKYLSLQDCRSISDDGILAIAAVDGCANLEWIDLKGTNVTDKSVLALEAACPRLRVVRLDSCRSISRKVRAKHSERERAVAQSGRLSAYERIALGRKRVEVIDDDSDDAQRRDAAASDSDFSDGSSS